MISEKLVNKYIDEYNKNHNSGVQEIEEMTALVHEYGKRKEGSGGVIIGTKRNKQGKLMVYQTKEQQHLLVHAGTGYGKTQGYVLNMLLNLGGNSSVVIADPKGEICSLTYNYLSALYGAENVGILNFRAPQNTQLRYNPFKTLAEEYYETRNMPAEQKEMNREKILSKLQSLVSNIFGIRTGNDPSWDCGARELILAILIALIEDTCEDSFNTSRKSELRKLISPDDVTMGMVIKTFSRFSWQAESGSWGDLGFFSSRADKSIAKQHAKTVLGTSSSGTRTSYLSLVNSYLEPYYNPKILDITSDHTVDVLSMAHKPKILFLIYDMTDEYIKKLVNDLIVNGLALLTEEYSKMAKPLEIPVIFLCDEFSSFSPHDIYPNILSVGRGMNIYLHLVIQSLAQLRAAYKEKADVIIENCGIKLFLGSNDYETARGFIEEIGSSIQLSKADLMIGKISYVERPRIKMNKVLYQMERGECFLKMMQSPPIHSYFEMFYNTPEYHVFSEFNISSIIAPKLGRKSPSLIEESRQEDVEEKRIKEARAALEKRKAEILKRMMETVDDDDEEEEEDDYNFLDDEIDDVVDCIQVLTDNELDLLEAAIKNGSISENWLRRYSDFDDEEEPMDIINRFLKLGIVKKISSDNYMILFSLDLFKRARKRL